MSECSGDVRFYRRSFAVFTGEAIADGVMDPIYLCDNHLAERKREERAKIARGRIEQELVGYHALPTKLEPEATCADADWDRLGQPERPPETLSYWDNLFRDSRERQPRELEAVALNGEYADTLRRKAISAIEAIADGSERAMWLRQLAREALARIDGTLLPPRSSSE